MSQETTSENHKQTKTVNAIPLKTAQKWAKRWTKKEGDYNKHHHVNAFLIPKVDLLEVLAEGVDAVRAYIGIDDNNVEKLMIVGTKYDPVTKIYVDMITVGVGNATAEEDNIYDFSTPCPPAGDPESPLNV
ncbi:MAG: hypothetical protein Q8R22_03865 [Flavobacterium sp.]|jgi:hypothetical protein|uniref:hypothetical protein n=1 Tax=unclassified Flavobacterium TaxID=196869 RepID=UPI000C1846E3|nr:MULTISPECIES: hypothetical protein [unclassified Flavobacterium]MDP3679953.1 hypothetical protein [Flavobacterium sp.]PIF63548.1 hypothetical protein CLV00_3263 [Flavobacterium sp. 11]WKL44773.1 hypothetical protein Q1W72_03940 [Flavobacterium sp. ZE23DGlu08]